MSTEPKNVKVESITFDVKTVVLIAAFCASIVGTYRHSMSRQNDIEQAQSAMLNEMQKLSKQSSILITLMTFRTDPWSGDMMLKYHQDWIDWVKIQDPTFTMDDGPDIRTIQRELAHKLVPENIIDELEMYRDGGVR